MPLGSRPFYTTADLIDSKFHFSGPLETLNPDWLPSRSTLELLTAKLLPGIFYQDDVSESDYNIDGQDAPDSRSWGHATEARSWTNNHNHGFQGLSGLSIRDTKDHRTQLEDMSAPRSPPQSQEIRKFPTRSQQRDTWARIKHDVHRIYIKEGKTLQETMYALKQYIDVSERTWKAQLKKWNYDKNISKNDMAILVSKKKKRSRYGKDTWFFHVGRELTQERFASFQKRKTSESLDMELSDAATPSNVAYGTPGAAEWAEDEGSYPAPTLNYDQLHCATRQAPSMITNTGDDHTTISTPGINERLKWYLNGLSTALRGASCDFHSLSPTLKHDLHILKGDIDTIGTYEIGFDSLCLNLLERARRDTMERNGINLEDGLIRYLGAIALCLRLPIQNRNIFIPHIFDYIKLQKDLDLHIHIATYMRHNPFHELFELVSRAYGPIAQVTHAMCELVRPPADQPDVAWTRLMYTLLKAVEIHRAARRPKYTILCQLQVAQFLVERQSYLIVQRLLSQMILEYVTCGLRYKPEEGLPLIYLIPDKSLEWLEEWSPSTFSTQPNQHETLKECLKSSIFELQMHLMTTPRYLDEERFDIAAIPAFAIAAIFCGERCAPAVKIIYDRLLQALHPQRGFQVECFMIYTLLCRAVHYATLGMEGASQWDLRMAVDLVYKMKGGFQRHKMVAILEAVQDDMERHGLRARF